MIQVEHIVKEFVSPKKYPGLKGAIKGLFSTEKVRKLAVDDISFSIDEGRLSVILEAMVRASLPPSR